MKITIPVPTEVQIKRIEIAAPVNYDEEEIPNDFPGRKGDTWHALIEVDTGEILDWPKGREEKMHLTVKDGGVYSLYGKSDHDHVATINQDYVPHGIIPGSYGDTIELDIGGDGIIKNWPKKPKVDAFFHTEED